MKTPRRQRPHPSSMPAALPLAVTPVPEGLPRGLIWLAWGSVGLAVITLFGLWPLHDYDLVMHLTTANMATTSSTPAGN